jgi:hypothetical protein
VVIAVATTVGIENETSNIPRYVTGWTYSDTVHMSSTLEFSQEYVTRYDTIAYIRWRYVQLLITLYIVLYLPKNVTLDIWSLYKNETGTLYRLFYPSNIFPTGKLAIWLTALLVWYRLESEVSICEMRPKHIENTLSCYYALNKKSTFFAHFRSSYEVLLPGLQHSTAILSHDHGPRAF